MKPLDDKKYPNSSENHEKNHDNSHKESISQEPIKDVYKEKSNETAEMLTFVPKIEEKITTLKEYWVDSIIYTADQRMERAHEDIIDHQSYFEQTYENTNTHLNIIVEEIKKYPEWIKLPSTIILSAQVTDKSKLKKIIDANYPVRSKTGVDIINSKWWHYSHHESSVGTIYLNSGWLESHSKQRISWVFHHEIFHLQDEEYDWIDNDNFTFWPYITEYSYHSTNEAQAELARYLYIDPKYVVDCIASWLANWDTTILEQLSMITWCKINEALIREWTRTEKPIQLFTNKLTPEEQKELWIHKEEFYGKWLPEIDHTFRNWLFEKWIDTPVENTSLEENDKSKTKARIFFDTFVDKSNDEFESKFQYGKSSPDELVHFIANVYNKKFIVTKSSWDQKEYSLMDFNQKGWNGSQVKLKSQLFSITFWLRSIREHSAFFDSLKKLGILCPGNYLVDEKIKKFSEDFTDDIPEHSNYEFKNILWEYSYKFWWQLMPYMIAKEVDDMYHNFNNIIQTGNEHALARLKVILSPWAAVEEKDKYIKKFHENIEEVQYFEYLYDEKWEINKLPKDIRSERKRKKQKDYILRRFTPSEHFPEALKEWEIFITPFDYLKRRAKNDWNTAMISLMWI